MFRRVLWIAAVLFLLCGACAAEQYWSKDGDLYYHAFSGCLGKEGMLQQDASGKAPCPVCLPVKDMDTEICAVERGGTIVVRIPDGCMEPFAENKERFVSDFGNFSEPIEYPDRTAQSVAAGLLCGNDYIAFMQAWESGSAKTAAVTGRSFIRKPKSDSVSMNTRHIDGAWYDINHSFGKSSDRWDINVRVDCIDIWTEGDTLVTFYRDGDSLDLALVPESMKGMKPVFSGKYDNLELSIYDAIETYIAVFHEPVGNAESLEYIGLDINSYETDILMNGYMNGKMAVFCCVLTDAEVLAIESGAVPKLIRPSRLIDADFIGSAYAVVYTSNNKCGIIDRSGEWVVEPKYDAIDYGYEEFLTQKQFLCWTGYGKESKVTVLDGNTLEILMTAEGYSRTYSDFENPSILCLYTADEDMECHYYLLPSGERLFDSSESERDVFRTARYEETVEGYPQRIVMRESKADGKAYLADNYGSPVSDTYDNIIPLFWKNDKGLFLAEYIPSAVDWYGDYSSGEVYNGIEQYGVADYCCGLIDQDGNAVTGMDYVAVEFVSIDEIRMIREDETFVTITPADWM